MNSGGIALIITLAFILAIVVLANAVLIIITSQTNFALHRVRQMQAFYSAQAGMVFTMEQLRTGVWGPGESHTLNDSEIPFIVDINIGNIGSGIGNTLRIESRAH